MRADVLRLIAGVAAVAAVILPAASAVAAERPLVYVIVLDALDGDRVEQGKAPFISSLLAGEGANAAYFPQSRSVIPAETNPNHVAMMSGAYPGRSGNPSNTFAIYAPLEHEDSCAPTGAFDYAALPTETSGESASCPQVELAFEAIKRQGNPDRLATAGVFGKPKLGRIFSGRNVDPARTDADYLWAPCSPGTEDDAYCEDVPTNPVSGYALDDETVMDHFLTAVEGGVDLPHGRERPGFAFVSLHQIDSAGHATGTGSLYDAAIAMADDQVERLVTTLRGDGVWGRTVLILVSDHSMDMVPAKISLTEAFTDAGIPESSFVALNNESSIDFIYLADRTSEARFELLKQMREVALAQPGVTEALYREPNPLDGGAAHTIDGVHPDWRATGERTGDLFVLAGPGVGFGEPATFNNPLPGNHGAPQTEDNFLAIVGGGDLVRAGEIAGTGRRSRPINVDVAPTAMGLLGLFAPESSRGRFLTAVFDRGELRRVARPHKPRLRVRRGRLLIRPAGGTYDIQVRDRRRWETLRRRDPRAQLKLNRLGDGRQRLRVRSRSAANVPSRWRELAVRVD